MRTITFDFGTVKYTFTMRAEQVNQIMAMVPPAARQMTMAQGGTIDVGVWQASAPAYPLPLTTTRPLTWDQFIGTMRAIRDGKPYDADALPHIHRYGYITGSQSDAAGLLLTTRGRQMLEDCERDSADLERQLTGMANALFGSAPR